MGFITRIKRLTTSRIETFLTTVEDPEILFPQLVKEMEEQIRKATSAEAKAMAGTKAAQRELDTVKDKLDRMQKGASLAMDQGDEDTAREAITAQIALEAEIQRKDEALARSQGAQDDAKAAREEIQSQLDEIRNKKDEILTRVRVAKNQKTVARTIGGPVGSAKSILDTVAQIETSVEETESQLEVQRDMATAGGGKSLDKRLKDLETSSAIEARLAALKQSTASVAAS
jgi:phage shock protein A